MEYCGNIAEASRPAQHQTITLILGNNARFIAYLLVLSHLFVNPVLIQAPGIGLKVQIELTCD